MIKIYSQKNLKDSGRQHENQSHSKNAVSERKISLKRFFKLCCVNRCKTNKEHQTSKTSKKNLTRDSTLVPEKMLKKPKRLKLEKICDNKS